MYLLPPCSAHPFLLRDGRIGRALIIISAEMISRSNRDRMPFPSINAGGLECLSWLGSSSGCGAEGGKKQKKHQGMGVVKWGRTEEKRFKKKGTREGQSRTEVCLPGWTRVIHLLQPFWNEILCECYKVNKNLLVVNSSLINFRDIELIYKFLQAYD